jgi:hypothetical protein
MVNEQEGRGGGDVLLYLDMEDDVDGAGDIGSRESRGSDELKFAMIKSTALHLEFIYKS